MSDQARDIREQPFFWIAHEVFQEYARVVGPIAWATLCCLLHHAREKNTTFPAIRTIAKEIGASESSVKRAIKTLSDHGLISVEHRRDAAGDPTSNLYTILDPQKGGSSVNPPPSSEDPGVGSEGTHGGFSVTPKEETPKEQSTEDLAQPRKAVQTAMKNIRRTKIKNALVEATNSKPETRSGWKPIESAALEIDNATQHLTDDQVVSEIFRRAKNYKREFSWMRITAPALAKYWGECGAAPIQSGPVYQDWTHGDPRGRV